MYEKTTVAVLASYETLIIPQIVNLNPVLYDLLVSTDVSDVSVMKSCTGHEVFLSFRKPLVVCLRLSAVSTIPLYGILMQMLQSDWLNYSYTISH